ncbi:esterase family protein [Telluribacter sp.]|jgi:esterase/lipase superfamily enzyme|uniref:esterase family protein n=1 Tax=Telluribacter sp. TaxID=1978767 RepID=UPI002E154AE9|nr:alpha/beta hydrolase-fold protein [Telluribacter sp.]
MQREVSGWFSPALDRQMDVAVYGHYGFALLLLPTADTGFLEYEQQGLIESIRSHIEAGKVKVFCIGSATSHRPAISNEERVQLYQLYYDYIFREVVPFIKEKTSDETPLIAAGASVGAVHSANLFFKHPDLVHGIIAMSGCYDLSHYTNGFYDQDVYFNSPGHYLTNLNAEWHLGKYRQSRHIHLITGSGAYEDPNSSRYISTILTSKGVPHELDIWGEEYPHEWWVWHRMMNLYLETKF